MSVQKSQPVMLITSARGSVALASALQVIGFRTVELVSEPSEADHLLDARRYGLVVAEWALDQNGLQSLLVRLRKREQARRLPFLVVVQAQAAGDISRIRAAGASGVILAPFTSKTLREKLQQLGADA